LWRSSDAAEAGLVAAVVTVPGTEAVVELVVEQEFVAPGVGSGQVEVGMAERELSWAFELVFEVQWERVCQPAMIAEGCAEAVAGQAAVAAVVVVVEAEVVPGVVGPAG
jgi:hypothetical protein